MSTKEPVHTAPSDPGPDGSRRLRDVLEEDPLGIAKRRHDEDAEAPLGSPKQQRFALIRLVVVIAVIIAVGFAAGVGETVLLIGALLRLHHAPRARPLPHGQVRRHQGHRVLRRLRAPPVVGAPRRDRVRRQGPAPRAATAGSSACTTWTPRSTPPTSPAPTAGPVDAAPAERGGGRLGHALPDRHRRPVRHVRRDRATTATTFRYRRPTPIVDVSRLTTGPSPAAAAGFRLGRPDRIGRREDISHLRLLDPLHPGPTRARPSTWWSTATATRSTCSPRPSTCPR